jgi:hypothetical protein
MLRLLYFYFSHTTTARRRGDFQKTASRLTGLLRKVIHLQPTVERRHTTANSKQTKHNKANEKGILGNLLIV